MITNSKLIFWDFDGVIKDSVSVKTDAFAELFSPYGKDVQNQVIEHHLENGGMSRFEKIPYYFSNFVGTEIDRENLEKLFDRFSVIVLDKVVASPWVPGAMEYILSNEFNQEFVLITGTPKTEIDIILERLSLSESFAQIYGAPESKSEAIRKTLETMKYNPDQTIFVGDSRTDMDAAQKNNVPFLLRKTPDNLNIQKECVVNSVDDFINIRATK